MQDSTAVPTAPPFDPTTLPLRTYRRKGGDTQYLDVRWRLLWLRETRPLAVISTNLEEISATAAVFSARITLPDGALATGWGSETADDFKDFIEKAETKALGRALAALGYGTQFATEYESSADTAAGTERAAPKPEESAAPSEAAPDDAARVALIEQLVALWTGPAGATVEALEKYVRDRYNCAVAALDAYHAERLIANVQAKLSAKSAAS